MKLGSIGKGWQQLLLGFLLIVITHVIGAFFTGIIGGGVGYFFTGILCAICMGLALAKISTRHGHMLWLGLVCIPAAFLCGHGTYHYHRSLTGLHLEQVTVSELLQYPNAVYAELKDAKIQMEYSSTHSYSRRTRQGGTITHHSIVAPLTDADWRPDQVVPAWVLAGGLLPPAEWTGEVTAGTLYVVEGDQNSQLLVAVQNACKKKNLITNSNPPILEWGTSPRLIAHRKFMMAAWLSMIAIFPLLVSVGRKATP